MKQMTGVLAVAVVVLVTQGCGEAESESDPFASGEVVVQGEHVLDFSAFPDGGTRVGDMHNLAFAIIEETPRVFVPEDGRNHVQGPEAWVSYDKARCDSPAALESSARGIARVHSANVDVVTVQVKPEHGNTDAGELCFGYRTVGGGWTWELAPIALTLRPETGMLEVDLPVHEERVDGIKLMSTGRSAPLVSVRYTTF